MKVVAISVGRPREVEWRGDRVLTSIFKEPRTGRVHAGRENLEGDEQSDLSVHGGRDKAVYAYPSEHYDFWRRELILDTLNWGAFGENLTTQGMLETEVCIGDRYRIGTAEFIVTQPRMPCYKLGVRFGRSDMVKRFYRSRRSGFYFAVAVEGDVESGDDVKLLGRDSGAVTIAASFLNGGRDQDD
ncbi:MAG: MOSC domain-containing protein [Gemmatimonadota bacterium]